VVSMGDYAEAMAPGSLVSVFGKNLAQRPKTADDTPWPVQLSGVRVQLDGADLPEVFASPGQVNVQIPFDAPADGTLRVVTDNGSAQRNISLSPTAPSILVVTTLDAAVSDRNPLSASSPVVIYATGLGACGSGAAAGSLAPAPSPVVGQVEVWLGDLQ